MGSITCGMDDMHRFRSCVHFATATLQQSRPARYSHMDRPIYLDGVRCGIGRATASTKPAALTVASRRNCWNQTRTARVMLLPVRREIYQDRGATFSCPGPRLAVIVVPFCAESVCIALRRHAVRSA